MWFGTTTLILSGVLSMMSGNLDLLWPLNNKTYTAEVLQAAEQNVSPGCDTTFGTDQLNGLFPFSLEDGASIDLLVESSIDSTGKDYSFSGWVKTSGISSSLFHYKANNNLAVFQEMKLVSISQHLQATRIVHGVAEVETSTGPAVTSNHWHYVSFGMSRTNGKFRVKLDSDNAIEHSGHAGNIDIELPGILRIGGTFDDSAPPLNGYVTCFGFHTDDSIPTSTDAVHLCQKPQTSVYISYTPTCSGRNTGQFVRYTPLTNTLQEVRNSTQCSVFQCAAYCLQDSECRYIQYNVTYTGCTTCLLLNQGNRSINPNNGRLYILNV